MESLPQVITGVLEQYKLCWMKMKSDEKEIITVNAETQFILHLHLMLKFIFGCTSSVQSHLHFAMIQFNTSLQGLGTRLAQHRIDVILYGLFDYFVCVSLYFLYPQAFIE